LVTPPHILKRIAMPVGLLVGLMVIGVAGYRVLGGPETSWFDALYMAVNVLTTTGFREAVQVEGRPSVMLFTVLLLLFGVSIGVYAISMLTAFIVEGDLTEGIAVLGELLATRRPVVVVEGDETNLSKIEEEHPDVPLLRGDFTDDAVLLQAGIQRAAGIVLCVDSDKDALVGTVVARQLSPSIRVIVRATDERARTRLRAAGADGVVSPAMIGGMRLASELVRPTTVNFLDRMLRAHDRSTRIEDIPIERGSSFVGQTIQDIAPAQYANLLLLAVHAVSGDVIYNPPESYRVEAGSTLIVMGEAGGVLAMRAAGGVGA
jgi:voltage-gated potassium channel